jgi:hypothetical protein
VWWKWGGLYIGYFWQLFLKLVLLTSENSRPMPKRDSISRPIAPISASRVLRRRCRQRPMHMWDLNAESRGISHGHESTTYTNAEFRVTVRYQWEISYSCEISHGHESTTYICEIEMQNLVLQWDIHERSHIVMRSHMVMKALHIYICEIKMQNTVLQWDINERSRVVVRSHMIMKAQHMWDPNAESHVVVISHMMIKAQHMWDLM